MAKAKRYNQKQMKKRLEADGWVNTGGGKHVIKMSKPGFKPITLPAAHGETYSVSMSQGMLKHAGLDDD